MALVHRLVVFGAPSCPLDDTRVPLLTGLAK
jgi:hypothetical protein